MKYILDDDWLTDKAVTCGCRRAKVIKLEDIKAAPTVEGDCTQPWISVKDRLPDPGKRVLATNGYAVGEAYRDIGSHYRRYYGVGWEVAFREPVTHWQELPEPPEKEAPHE